MIDIYLPDNNLPERHYVTDVLFGEYLGLSYRTTPKHGIAEYEIKLENGNLLIIEDHFFSKFPADLQYLKQDNIPGQIVFAQNNYTPEKDIAVLFGNDKLIEEHNKSKKIISGHDCFASVFFMFTRWEEYVNKTRDDMIRFPANASIAKKFSFLHRPVVNEYVEFIWKVLKYLGCKQKRKPRQFSPLLTHDVDFILRWYSVRHLIKALGADLIRKKDVRNFTMDLADFVKVKFHKKKDPFDTFDYLMHLSEENNLTSHFFFMSIDKMKNLQYYKLSHPRIKTIMNEIISRGHRIGFHPGINTCTNHANWKAEYEYLQSISPVEIKSGRQHYLQFEAPLTWQIWNDMKMEWDSTLSYHDDIGFRAGTCYPFSTFNFLTRKKLDLIERPLIIMDKPLVQYNLHLGYDKILSNALNLVNTIKKYQGEFTLLWHNNCFNVKEWKAYQKIYSEIVYSCNS